MNTIIDEAIALDEKDELASFREQFHLPVQKSGEPYIYFCGNSLGLQPKTARRYVEEVMKDWELMGVEAHTEARNPWMSYHEILTDQLADLVGAMPHEVVAMNSLTVNLHLMMVSFYRPEKDRFKIIIEKGAFPSDRYAVESQIKFHGYDPDKALIELEPREGESTLRTVDILDTINQHGSSTALIMMGNVNYYTGQAFNMKEITRVGHNNGCKVAFDLAHGAGNIVCDLHDVGADFAAWCSYKYLNAGPGATSGCFVHERHSEDDSLPRFAGWWGHDKSDRFKMGPEFKVLPGAEGWQLSNPPILPMACLKASLDIFEAAGGIKSLRRKSENMTQFLLSLLQPLVGGRIEVITPLELDERGCQISIRVKSGDRKIYEKLTAGGLIADWREPDVIRIAPAPLYNSYEDIARFVELLKLAMF